jgi:hypothetical protein
MLLFGRQEELQIGYIQIGLLAKTTILGGDRSIALRWTLGRFDSTAMVLARNYKYVSFLNSGRRLWQDP